MPDEARNAPLFGLNIDPMARDLETVFRLSAFADEAELDFVSIQDHPYIPNFLETWTLLAAIGARTRAVRLLPNVFCLPLRPPSVLAKAAATLDLITAGRVELGLGAGAFWEDIAGYGGERLTPSEAVKALEEAMRVCREIWSTDASRTAATFNGTHYTLRDAKPGPAPAHEIGIWLGAIGPRMQRLTGRLADGWIVSTGYIPPERLPDMQGRIDRAAIEAGRSPNAIRRAYNVSAYVTVDGESPPTVRPGTIVGSADEIADEIARFYNMLRMDTFLFRAGGGDVEEQARRFSETAVPAVRARIR
ncbi:MAG TPA: LLM class flavin-dependent oxidoreductase [Thermomicrobiales bacterium]|nr:LLM class flavin-dependent oxidoreductase [Thermomicrobiales bacterium]